MDALLIERWLGDGERTPVHDQASVSLVRIAARSLGERLGLPEVAVGSLAIVVSELATNQLRHARYGVIALRPVVRAGVPGVEVVAADQGPGIRDAGEVVDGAPRVGGGLGIGLSGVQRQADEVDFDVRLGQGTCVRARKFAAPVPRRREVAILGRPCAGERTSGDDATFERRGDLLLLALADGLGHGPDALVPARRAIDRVHDAADTPPSALLRDAHEALRGTRGAVMGVVRLDEASSVLRHAAVGNVVTRVRGDAGGRSYDGAAGVLGANAPFPGRLVEESATLGPRDVVMLCSDGLRTRLDPAEVRNLSARHPLVLAQHLLDRFGRDNDDATLIVAR